MTACEYIDKILCERNISRRQLAKMAKIAPSTLQSAMSRNGYLSLDILLPVLEALGISVTSTDAATFLLSEEQYNFMLSAWHSGWLERSDEKPLTPQERLFIETFFKLNDEGQEKAVDYVQLLAENEKYLK